MIKNSKLTVRLTAVETDWDMELSFKINGARNDISTAGISDNDSCCGIRNFDQLASAFRYNRNNNWAKKLTLTQIMFLTIKATLIQDDIDEGSKSPFYLITMPTNTEYKAASEVLDAMGFLKTKARLNNGSGNMLKCYIVDTAVFMKKCFPR